MENMGTNMFYMFDAMTKRRPRLYLVTFPGRLDLILGFLNFTQDIT